LKRSGNQGRRSAKKFVEHLEVGLSFGILLRPP
jgi:hypothetical protein